MDKQKAVDLELKQAEDFVRQNIIDLSGLPAERKIGTACGDGRNTKEAAGWVKMFGASGGIVLAIAAETENNPLSELAPEEIVNRVVEVHQQLELPFDIHSDDHTEGHKSEEGLMEKAKLGCGHLSKPTLSDELAKQYGFKNTETPKRIVKHLRKLVQEGKIRRTDLQGPHQEKSVFIVKGTDIALVHQGGTEMNFVWEQDRANEFIKQIVGRLNIPGITPQATLDRVANQTMVTASLLASGFPVFEVTKSSEEVKVTPQGHISS